MKAIVCQDFGPVENLRYRDVPDPRVKPGEVLIDVEAAGVNFPDSLLVEGRYQIKPPTPFIPGSEVAGRISEVGAEVTGLKPGQRVVTVCTLGGFAEKVAVDARRVLPIGEQVPAESAAGLLVAHATAHHALKQRGQLQADETLLVTGAAGGTGLAAVQIGKAMGARVIAVCSSAEKLAIAAENGADVLINSSDGDLVAQLKAAGGERGVDVAYEVVGGSTFDACVRAMGWNGRLLVIGFAGGSIPQFPVNLALVKGMNRLSSPATCTN